MAETPTRPTPKPTSKFVWLVMASFLAVMFWQRFAPINSAVAWETDVTAAMRAADDENKPILMNFSSPSCTYCRKMEAEVFPRPEVLTEMQHFIPVKIDAQSQYELAARYDIQSLPTFVVSYADGRPVGMVEGYHGPQEFIDFLKRAASLTRSTASRVKDRPQ